MDLGRACRAARCGFCRVSLSWNVSRWHRVTLKTHALKCQPATCLILCFDLISVTESVLVDPTKAELHTSTRQRLLLSVTARVCVVELHIVHFRSFSEAHNPSLCIICSRLLLLLQRWETLWPASNDCPANSTASRLAGEEGVFSPPPSGVLTTPFRIVPILLPRRCHPGCLVCCHAMAPACIDLCCCCWGPIGGETITSTEEKVEKNEHLFENQWPLVFQGLYLLLMVCFLPDEHSNWK